MDLIGGLLLNFILNTSAMNSSRIVEVYKHFIDSDSKTVPVFVGECPNASIKDVLQLTHSNLASAQYFFRSYQAHAIYNSIRYNANGNVSSLVFCSSHADSIWQVVDKSLRKLRRSKMIVVLTTDKLSYTQIQLVFNKLWTLQFTQVLVLYEQFIYSYTPYPSIQIFEVTDIDRHKRDPISDFQGYPVITPIENDIPRIFCVTENGQLDIKGYAYQIFINFIKHINATLVISNPHANRSIYKSVNMSHILHSIEENELEISTHPYTGINREKGILSYPVFKVRNCLIVPVRNEIPRYMYLLRPWEAESWILIFLSVFYIAFILVWINPAIRKMPSFADRWFLSIMQSMTHVFYIAPPYQISSPSYQYFITYILLSVLGFFTTAWYSNLLSSFLTTILVGSQIDSFEDIIASGLPIMVKYYEKRLILGQVPPKLVDQFSRLLVPVNASVMVAHLLRFNTSFAYHVTEERWRFLSLQQQYANKPIYRFSSICFGEPTIAYPMRLDSHLEFHLNKFIFNIQQAGLDKYWLISDFREGLKAGFVRLLDNVMLFKPFDIYSLQVAFYVLICGCLAAIILFIVELLVGKYYKRVFCPS